MSFQEEFPAEFNVEDHIVAALIAANFTDVSWHNDSCPSFEFMVGGGDRFLVFIDAKNREHREYDRGDRFYVTRQVEVLNELGEHDVDDQCVLSVESFDEVRAFFAEIGVTL